MYNDIDNYDLLCMLYNIIKMMEGRGYLYLSTNYEIIKKEKESLDINMNIEISDYTYLIKNKCYILFRKNNKYKSFLFVKSFYDNETNITYIYKQINDFMTWKDIWRNKNILTVLICDDDIEDKIIKKIKEDNIMTKIMETVSYSSVLYNITEHADFVKHEKIKNYEKKYIKYNLTLPVLLNTDPVSRWYDYNINDIIKITRNDKSITYRIVKTENVN